MSWNKTNHYHSVIWKWKRQKILYTYTDCIPSSMTGCSQYKILILDLKSQTGTRWEQVTMVTMLLRNIDFPSEWVFYTCSYVTYINVYIYKMYIDNDFTYRTQ